jgi:hypothetical protein
MTAAAVFRDVGWALLLLIALPAGILLIGTPVALFVRLIIEIVERL